MGDEQGPKNTQVKRTGRVTLPGRVVIKNGKTSNSEERERKKDKGKTRHGQEDMLNEKLERIWQGTMK